MKATLAAALLTMLVARVVATPSQPLPQHLSETGLYVPGTTRIDPRNQPYSPQYPLWTDGARKSRWVQLPAGSRIDAEDVDRWDFPVGTRFWKEFAFNGVKVETRLLWRSSQDAWSFAAYAWNADQTDATLVPPEGAPNVAEVTPGKRHSIPSVDDCRACHENGRTQILGFTALQLSADRDPGAPHAEPLAPDMLTVRRLVEADVFAPPRPQLSARPPRIEADAMTRSVLGYLTGNCGHCHNDESTLATVRYPLLMPAYATAAEIEGAIATLRSSTTKWDIPHTQPGRTQFLQPGDPDASALFVRMRSRRPSTQMPPLGTVVQDKVAMDLIAAWIRGRS